MMEYKGTLTVRIQNAADCIGKEFRSMYTGGDFRNKIEELKNALSERPSILAELFRMFNSVGVEYERGKSNTYYEQLVERLIREGTLPTVEAIEDQILMTLYDRFEDYPDPAQYLLRLVNRLEDPADGWREDPLRLRILKQFVKYTDALKAAGYGGKTCILRAIREASGRKNAELTEVDYLDDSIFDLLDTATDSQKKPAGGRGLLKAVDDLANGMFRMEGATRKLLYLFAMAYGMTYYSGAPEEVMDHRTDLEKNLFTDFYVNNVMRLITSAYEGTLAAFDPDPGQGINYKNMADVVYLYYIAQPELTPLERVEGASAMIERIKEQGKAQGNRADQSTMYLKQHLFQSEGQVFIKDILRDSPAEFEAYICRNYDCDTVVAHRSVKKNGVMEAVPVYRSEMTLAADQNSAFRVYRQILDKMEKLGVNRLHCNYGLWFTDPGAFLKGCHAMEHRHPELDPEKFRKFRTLLLAINHYLGCTVKEKEARGTGQQQHEELLLQRTKLLFLEKPEEMTRTAILVAFYYYFNEKTMDQEMRRSGEPGADSLRNRSFPRHLEAFRREVDPLLEACGYQPFTTKNLFDLVVAFSSYSYLNL